MKKCILQWTSIEFLRHPPKKKNPNFAIGNELNTLHGYEPKTHKAQLVLRSMGLTRHMLLGPGTEIVLSSFHLCLAHHLHY